MFILLLLNFNLQMTLKLFRKTKEIGQGKGGLVGTFFCLNHHCRLTM